MEHRDEQFSQSSTAFEQFLEFVPDAIVGVAGDGAIVLVNGQAEKLFGYPREDLLGETLEMLVPQRFHDVHPEYRRDYFREPRTRPMGIGVELYARRRDGTEFPVEISLSSLALDGQTIAAAAIRDISDRAESERERALQAQLDRARRLESVGQLAGGIAHDFNNLLGVIMNYAEFVAGEVDTDSQAAADLLEIRRAAERAAALTRQLLIFSRREVAKPQLLKVGQVVADLENLLRRALGERVTLETSLPGDEAPIEVDPAQLEQVLVNLAVNARDAMPDGGRLLIEAEAAELDEEYAYMHPETPPGPYLRLKVSDTGIGMDRETIERAFEPFFTTKEEGTGLGLATVYGIVTNAGGRIDIYSERGIGTTVKVHFPLAEDRPQQVEVATAPRPHGQGEIVLVVEDEPGVRRMAERILSKGGYSVLGTDEAERALEIFKDDTQQVDLLLTDVIMPGMLGTELVEAVHNLRPTLRVLYMSGYSHEVLAPKALAEDGNSAFIEKPFNADELLRTVANLLGREAGRE